MSLKLIPVEPTTNDCGKKQKYFNPRHKIKGSKRSGKDFSLKGLCLSLIHFINRGSKFTYEQIDDLIMMLHKSILSLQKKKQEILRNKK